MNLLSLIKDDTGALSSMRLAFLFTVFAIVTVWVVISIRTNTFAPLPEWSWKLLAIAFGSKTVQSLGENFSSPTPQTPPTTNS